MPELRAKWEPHGLTVEACPYGSRLRIRFEYACKVPAEYWPSTKTLRLTNESGKRTTTTASDVTDATEQVAKRLNLGNKPLPLLYAR